LRIGDVTQASSLSRQPSIPAWRPRPWQAGSLPDSSSRMIACVT
jgi:hypothetical protein